MFRRNVLLFIIVLGMMAGISGCGASIPPPITQEPTPISVIFVSTPPASLAVNASATIYAATTFSSVSASNNTAVTYTISCASANACGTIGPSDEVGAIVYMAPPAIPSGGTVTVTAASVVKPSLESSASITVVAPIPISVVFTAPASLQVSARYTLRALIENDVSANPQVTWTVSCGATACGSFSPTTTTSDEATTYTAPSTIPPGNTVTVTATSVTDTTKSASQSIVITSLAATLANGTYVFQIAGPGGSFVTGVLVAQNGAITGGEQDSVSDDNGSSYFQQFNSGSYGTTPDGNLEISIELASDDPADTETLSGTLASGEKGIISGIDGAIGNGTLELQTSTAAPSGGYAFALDPADFYDGSPWVNGIVNVDSAGGISGNGSILDLSYEGASSGGSQNLSASNVSAPDAFGRVVFQLNLPGNTVIPLLFVAGYMVDASHIRLLDVGNPMNSYVVIGAFGGVALGQGAHTGQFTATSVAGTSYVFGAEGEDTQGTLQLGGVLTLGAGGNVTGMLSWNDLSASAPKVPVAVTGNYTVDPTGRIAVTDLTDGLTLKYSLHLYLNGQGGGLLLSDDQDDVFAGQAFEQQSGAFTATSFSGNYGLSASLYAVPSDGVAEFANATGPVTATPSTGTDSVLGFADLGGESPDFAISGSFTPSANGVFTGSLSGFDLLSGSSANTFTLYLVDNTQGVAIETDRAQLTLARFALVE
jgi:hypothetical protein